MNSLSRRRFIAGAGKAGAAAVAASMMPRAMWGNPVGLPLGIQLYTVSKSLQEDIPGTLKQLHDTGYREVETAGLVKHTAKEFRAFLDDAGLRCPSSHLQLAGDNLDEQFADANALGAHYAVTSVLRSFSPAEVKALTSTAATPAAGSSAPPKHPPMQPLGLDGFKKTAARMNEVGKQAKAAGLQYAYHNHNFEFEKMPDGSYGYDVLVKETDPDLVKFEVDCGWMVVAGADPVAYFHNFPGRFRMLHIKDFQPVPKPTTALGGPERPKGADLGTGFVQYTKIFGAAKAAGIEHIFVEQEAPFPVSQMDSAKADYVFLQKFS
ncbi:sugar phosphate isomerase/epimerase family protein [Acidicapsa acidisoli]|uniref:sugar phosphate isomerase/epimerase family protein n=1 Tax=Acidicapsa acidisoli TaxID=1615681 RepID=UPI0021E088E3|nr:sugar phosphate isomerase/epimerase [Acidicapsa acidisoli]